jgi:hypothetical protein
MTIFAPDFFTCSEPPRSPKQSCERLTRASPGPEPALAPLAVRRVGRVVCCRFRNSSEWARELRSFISVAARRFAPSAWSSSADISSSVFTCTAHHARSVSSNEPIDVDESSSNPTNDNSKKTPQV